MNIMILGSEGFIGKEILKSIQSISNLIIACDVIGAHALISNKNVIKHKVDYANTAYIEMLMREYKVSHVIHAISTTTPSSSNDNMMFDVKSNLFPMIRFLEASVKVGLKKILFISSGGTIYGEKSTGFFCESDKTDPICSYGIVKLAIEKYLGLFHKLYGLNYLSMRLANPYGIGQDLSKTIGSVGIFTRKIIDSEVINIWGDGSIIRDFIHIDDVTSFVTKAIQSDKTGIYNVATGVGTSINQLIALIEKYSGKSAHVTYDARRECDVNKVVLDITLAKRDFSWEPEIKLDDGLKRYISELGYPSL